MPCLLYERPPMSESKSVLEFYMDQKFNPVPLSVSTPAEWQTHVQKRRNLYQHHLGIPFVLLKDRHILEFGCNTGENALVLAEAGARLTLVEPNDQTRPLIRPRFKERGLEDRLVAVSEKGIDDFQSGDLYDLVVVEGFLYTMPNRDQLFKKMADFLSPGGLLVLSSVDRHGLLLESTKRMMLWRCLELAGIENPYSPEAMAVAKRLFYDKFRTINASRPFEAWVKDQLLNPFICSSGIWSVPELLDLADRCSVVYQSCSPGWAQIDTGWYKNITTPVQRHQNLLAQWKKKIPYFVTGQWFDDSFPQAGQDTVAALGALVDYLSDYNHISGSAQISSLEFPKAIDGYFKNLNVQHLDTFCSDVHDLFGCLRNDDIEKIIRAYHDSIFQDWWGVPYQYFCFTKE